MPGTPKESARTDVKGNSARLFLAEVEGGLFWVAFYDGGKGEPKARLDAHRNALVKNARGTLMNELQISLEGKHPGREIQIGVGTQYGHVADEEQRVKFYLVRQRLYEVSVTGPKPSWCWLAIKASADSVLCVEGIEFLFQAFFRGLAGIDRAPDRGPGALVRAAHCAASSLKKRKPLQWEPVILLATPVNDLNRSPAYSKPSGWTCTSWARPL